MNFFVIQLDLLANFAVVAPTLQVEVNGSIADSLTLEEEDAGVLNTTIAFSTPFTGAAPSRVRILFDDNSPEIGRTVTINDVTINGETVGFDTPVLTNGGSTEITLPSLDDTFGQNDPNQADFGPVTLTGTAGNDTRLSGGAEDDIITALNGNDTVRGNDGNDVVFASGGNDRVFGGDGDDILSGEGGNDLIRGDNGEDTIFGGDGADRLFGGNDDDLIFGGEGNDRLSGQNGDDVLLGQGGDDILTGGNGNDQISGGEGDDNVSAQNGNDFVFGDSGEDLLRGGAGDDEIHGGDDDDVVVGDSGNDTLYGDNGEDTLLGRLGDDTLFGGNDNDLLFDQQGNDTLNGGDGQDVLIGGEGADILNGDAGDDQLYGHSVDQIVTNGFLTADPDLVFNAATNSFYKLVTTPETDVGAIAAANAATLGGVSGHLANITSAAENSFLQDLASGTQVWIGGSDAETEAQWRFGGGQEGDAIFYQGNVGGVAIAPFYTNFAANEPNDFRGGEDFLVLRTDGQFNDFGGPEFSTSTSAYIIEFDAGLINPDNAIDILNGGAGNDTLYGFGGNDILDGGADNDVLFGGTGNDTLTGGNGTDALLGQEGVDTLNGGAGADNLVGGVGADIIDGGAGNDTILLDNGDFAAGESIIGGDDTDTIELTNATVIDLSTGSIDTVEFLEGSIGNDNVTLSALDFVEFSTIDLAGGADALNVFARGDISAAGLPTVQNVENGSLVGDGANNEITLTGAQLDSIINGSGNIDLGGGVGDTINLTSTSADLNTLGANDSDILGLETVDASLSSGGVTIDLAAQNEGFTLNGGSGADTLTTGVGNDTLTGGAGNDVLTSGTGTDTLSGGAGDDVLNTSLSSVTSVSAFSTTFDSGLDGFIYTDGGFGGSDPTGVDYARGTFEATDGASANGSAEIILGGVDSDDIDDISGNFQQTFTIAQDLTNVTLSLSVRVFESGPGADPFDGGEDTQIFASIDGSELDGGSGDGFFVEFLDPDNNFDSGYQNFTLNVGSLNAGTHTLSLGALLTRKTFIDEEVTVRFDDVSVDGAAISGDLSSNILSGGIGNDTLNGGGGVDTLFGVDAADSALSSAASGSDILFGASFDTGLEGFLYSDGGFGGSDPTGVDYARGRFLNAGENDNGSSGALEITLGGVDFADIDDISGNFEQTFNVANDVDNSLLNFSFRVQHTELGTGTDDFDFGEDLQLFVELNGTQLDNGTGDGFFVEFLAPDNDFDTGWVNVSFDTGALSAGAQTLNIGALLTRKTFEPEEIAIRFDDIELVSQGTAISTGTTNILNGGGGADLLFGSTESDIFLFEALTAFDGVDEIENFNALEGDALDLSDLLNGFDPLSESISNFVNFTNLGSDTLVGVDQSGGGNFSTIAQINDVVNLNEDGLLSSGAIII